MSQSSLPPVAALEDDLQGGFIWLHVDYFAESGKWKYGYYARIPLCDLEVVKFDGKREFMRTVDRYQKEVKDGCWEHYYVTIDDSHYNSIAAYSHFFKQLYRV